MKKILITLLAVSSASVFADTFQDFNNNLYAQYGLTGYNSNTTKDYQTNGFGIGGTFQSANNVWVNTDLVQNNNLSGVNVGNTFGLKAGYAFQFFGDEDNGFQIIPFASFGYAGGGITEVNGVATSNVDAYKWGIGVQPEYRFLSSLKASLGLGLAGYNGFGNNGNSTTVFGFNVNPEVQYDIAKTVMVAVGYNYSSQFNGSNALNTNNLNVKVGYLF
ncbi:MAG: outer membrane beta-barrel protein [Burkholderiales bacterium]|nr:outer membrane beta-barrel protein [Burkholderiales bacterium]